MRRLGLVAVLVMLFTSKGEAQSDSLLTRVLSDSTSLLEVLHNDSAKALPSRLQIGPARLASSTGGFMFGMLVGGFVGSQMSAESCTGQCRDETTRGLLAGAAIGGGIGAGLGAAFLDLRSVCKFDKRLMRTLIGSSVGAYAAYSVAGGLGKTGRSAFFIPIGAIGGSLGTLGRCWQSRF